MEYMHIQLYMSDPDSDYVSETEEEPGVSTPGLGGGRG